MTNYGVSQIKLLGSIEALAGVQLGMMDVLDIGPIFKPVELGTKRKRRPSLMSFMLSTSKEKVKERK